MRKIIIKNFISIAIIALIFTSGNFVLPVFASSTDGTINGTYKYAWTENTGWLNFGANEGSVHITDSELTGYVWGENIGWVSLNCSNDSSCGTVDYKVSNDGEGNLTGYAWAENTGWLNFNPTNGGVNINSSGEFSGYAWGENISWIVFNCATTNSCGTVDYKVKTDWRPQSDRPACNNAADDDSDGRIDYPDDPGCSSLGDDDETDISGTVVLPSPEVIEIPPEEIPEELKEEKPVPTEITPPEIETIELPTIVVKPPIEKPPKPPIIERLPKILEPLVPEFLKPKPLEIVPPEIPFEELVPKEAPMAMSGEWDLAPTKAIEEFVLSPLPKEIRKLAEKFPELGEALKKVGITKITDIEKLKTVRLTLPGLTERMGLPTVKIEQGRFALPQGVPLAKLSAEIKQEIPTEIVFAKTAGELIDFNIALTITEKGEPQQKITTISGKPLQLVVKPDQPVKSIKGYVVFKSKVMSQKQFHPNVIASPHTLTKGVGASDSEAISEIALSLPSVASRNDKGAVISLNSLLGSLFFALPTFAQEHNPVEIEERLVLLEFEYTDPDGDGIYTADIQAPLVEGEYEIITVMDYEDPEMGSKEIRLITVVDPEGYIYEKDGDKETRIPGAIVSIFWLNTETKQYELWPAKEYQQENPQITNTTGKYSFLVPQGSYYLKVEAPGYLIYDGKPFQVKEGSGVHINIELKTKYWWLKVVDWKTLALIVVILFLMYNFYRDKVREKSLKK